jgi:hypothetical protein
MAKYRFLQPVYVGECQYLAGEIATLPDSWVPNPNVEPLDLAGAQAMWDAGPAPLGLVQQRWGDQRLWITSFPKTYWRQINKEEWELVGLGRGLGAKKATRPMELP